MLMEYTGSFAVAPQPLANYVNPMTVRRISRSRARRNQHEMLMPTHATRAGNFVAFDNTDKMVMS
jgi:hypothetical protein